MSWRVIFIALLLIAAASAWGGLQVGEWLVAYGPSVTVAPEDNRFSTELVLDADGRPHTAQPPQPLVDGRLAVPQKPDQTSWQIEDVSLAESDQRHLISIATTTITMAQAEQIASTGSGDGLAGIADVGALMDALGPDGALQPIDFPDSSTNPAPSQPENTAWRDKLQQALVACETESFFDRPSCAWAARNQYCTPNNAWGRVPECPKR